MIDPVNDYGRRCTEPIPNLWRDVDRGTRLAPTHLGAGRLAFFACGAWEGYWDALPQMVKCEGCHASAALALRMSNV